jgi:AcrR family transcriptional regulator
MYKLCKTKQSAARQAAISQCLLSLMETRPYGAITVCDICAAAQVPRKTFYRYFENKEDVLLAMVDQTLHRCDVYCGLWSTTAQLPNARFIENWFAFWAGQQRFLRTLEHSGLSEYFVTHAVNGRLQGGPGQSAQAPIPLGEIRLSVLFMLSGLFSVLMDWRKQNFSPSAQEMARITTGLLQSFSAASTQITPAHCKDTTYAALNKPYTAAALPQNNTNT